MKQLLVLGDNIETLLGDILDDIENVQGVIPLEFSPKEEKFVDERNPGYYNTGKMVLSKAIILIED